MKVDLKFRKIRFYGTGVAKSLIPQRLVQHKLPSILRRLEQHDATYIFDRVDYYNKFTNHIDLNEDAISYNEYTLKGLNSAYYFDFKELIRYFDSRLKFHILFGDIHWLAERPSFLKSRPISDNNQNAVILKLDKLRHFYFVKDTLSFKDKKNSAIFRGPCYQKHRQDFIRQTANIANTDIGDTRAATLALSNTKPYTSIQDQLQHKFIISVEGNDVATNLKWIMSSNSLCFMRRPRFETWYMEGKLIPNFHYVLLDDDYSNLDSLIQYYSSNTQEALDIIHNANEFTKQFQNSAREKLISLMVLNKYFSLSGQLPRVPH